MDNDNCNLETEIKTKSKQRSADASNIFQSARLRRSIQVHNGLDRFLLDYGFNFLPYVSVAIWIIFLLA
jgi:hypothetical protein